MHYIKNQEFGLETLIGENGKRLSGGQRQRLQIARTILTKPELVIMDEPTSALDIETEQIISESISKLHGSATLIVIAHRLSTVASADYTILMRDGEILKIGKFTEIEHIIKSGKNIVN